jgi:hypothetical protein
MRKRARRISCVFEKKEGRYKAFIIEAIVINRENESHSFWRDCDRGVGTSSSFGGTTTVGPCGTWTSSSSDGTTIVMGCNRETSSSPTNMCFALGTSSSLSLTYIANWSGGTGSSWRRRLDSPNRAMASV